MTGVSFTPVESGIGGMLVGLASAMTMLLDGKICGQSGIYGGFVRSVLIQPVSMWNMIYLVGIATAGVCDYILAKRDFSLPGPIPLSIATYALAGACGGVGTRLGCGCTSGHGVVGLARFSVRSFVAVCTFMAFGFITVNAKLLVSGTHSSFSIAPLAMPPVTFTWVAVALSAVTLVLTLLTMKYFGGIVPLASGFIFGLGLGASGMTSQYKVIGFLTLAGEWDPSLAFVMGGALAVTVPAFAYARSKMDRPLHATAKWEGPGPGPFAGSSKFDMLFVLGNALFGIAWGIAGICPGPGFTAAPAYLLSNYSSMDGWLMMVWLAAVGGCWLATDRALAAKASSSQPSSGSAAADLKKPLLANGSK
eukprot:CAMPEP_0178405264 /NCGR_PEP_ID=MMETSP0689_2-20121128/18310_1 /TAXON_ID=160604 /ORGANISM="Amphidinium massartii, Strain CS-259" /LENGTH=363 /DNA_ID=CAMNT_0020026275 /DNA_START=103 /DNA_END=1194 /DNA_ORIENTATION=-